MLWMRGYTVATSVISIGGILNGYDTGSIGAVTTMPYFEDSFGVFSPALRGFTVSFLLLMGAVPGFFAGQLADHFGHLRVVTAGALVFALGSTLEAAASTLAMFLVGRGLMGIGEGLWLTNVSVYITEIAPATRRGILVSVPQLMSTVGICAGYFTCYGSIHIESSMSWRLPLIIQTVAAVILAACCCYLPKSPRWLLQNSRRKEAMRQLERLHMPKLEAEKDILAPRDQKQQPNPATWEGFSSIFRQPYRSRTLLGLFVLGMVQLSGIDGVLYYAPILFEQAGLPIGKASFLASGVSAILMLTISIPAFLYADSWGRRTSIISGGLGLASCMFVIGSLYATDSVKSQGGAGRWFVIVIIFVFAMTYVSTWGIVAKIYASEVQPPETRAAANSIAQGLNFLTNWIVAFAIPIFLARSSHGAYFIFGSLSLFTVIVLAIFMPETRGKSLESIEDSFKQPISVQAPARLVENMLSGLRIRRVIPAGDDTSGDATLDSSAPQRPNFRSLGSAYVAPKTEYRAV